MILNHIWGLYTHPKEEWQCIEQQHESLIYSLVHILMVSLIPAICSYFSAAYVGWAIGSSESIKMSESNALIMAAGIYACLILGVFCLAYLILWMAKTFDAKPYFTQTLELASYAATPLLMVGVTVLFPVLWFVVLSGVAALCYSIYLLYSGVPIMMNIPEGKGFIFASSVVTSGLVMLVTMMAIAATLVSLGFSPEYL